MYVVVVVVLINGDMKNTFLAWSVLLIRPHVSGDELNYKQLIPTIKTKTKFEGKKITYALDQNTTVLRFSKCSFKRLYCRHC